MKVSVLVLERCTPIAPVGAMELLRKSGLLHQQRTAASDPFFDVELVGVRKRSVPMEGGSATQCHTTISEVDATDLLVIPAIDFDIDERLRENDTVLPHVRRLREGGAEVASLCTGAFLLAATGLLDGRHATTHWAMADRFREMFPAVRLLDERIVVDNGGLYCSGGATSFMSLIMYLVEKHCGKETAVAASKLLLVDYGRPPQSFYAIFTPQMAHGDAAVAQAQELVHQDPERAWDVAELARAAGLSARSLVRRFKAATGEAPGGYVQRVRMERAKELLETMSLSVQEVAARVGYADVPSFRARFARHTGLSPSAYRSRYRLATS